MLRICKKGKLNGKISPLCDNRDLYRNLKYISEHKGVSFEMMLSISFAESHIGVNFKPKDCGFTNNRGGLKGAKSNNSKLKTVKLPYKGCRLYPFESVEEYWNALANTLKMGYYDAGCNNATCLSDRYVGGPGVNISRVNRVNSF